MYVFTDYEFLTSANKKRRLALALKHNDIMLRVSISR